MQNELAKGVLIRGIESEKINELDFLKDNIIDGEINNLSDGSIIIGKYLAIELGVVVGDTINIMSSSSVSTPLEASTQAITIQNCCSV